MMSIIFRTSFILVGVGERMNLQVFTQGGCNSFGPELYFKLSDRYKDHLTQSFSSFPTLTPSSIDEFTPIPSMQFSSPFLLPSHA